MGREKRPSGHHISWMEGAKDSGAGGLDAKRFMKECERYSGLRDQNKTLAKKRHEILDYLN
jgi:hypothetical protein